LAVVLRLQSEGPNAFSEYPKEHFGGHVETRVSIINRIGGGRWQSPAVCKVSPDQKPQWAILGNDL